MNAAKAKGTKWETAIVGYLSHFFPHIERRTLSGTKDRGDISGLPGVVIEAKNENRVSLASWVDEAETEGLNAAADVCAVWAHRKGKSSPADGYVLMTGRQFVALLKEAGY